MSIVETLQEFRNILLGQQIKVYIDHRNLTYKTFDTEQVMPEEYSPELIYIQGSKNIAVGALSRLDKVDTPNPVQNNMSVNEHYALEDEDILWNQQKNTDSIKTAQYNKDYSIQNFDGVDKKYYLIFKNCKIVIPKQL